MLVLRYLTGHEGSDKHTGNLVPNLAQARTRAAWLLKNDPDKRSGTIGILADWGWFDGSVSSEPLIPMSDHRRYDCYTETEWPGIWETRWPAADKRCYNREVEPAFSVDVQQKLIVLLVVAVILGLLVFVWGTFPDTAKMTSDEYLRYQQHLDDRQWGNHR